MIIIALTGSVGTGKTETSKYFIKNKIPVFDCDKVIGKLLKTDDVTDNIKKFFPTTFENRKLNRRKLAELVFVDKKKLSILEKILYRKLSINQSSWIRTQIMRRESKVVFDVPLLFEKDDLLKYDLIVLVTCSKDVQKRRVLRRADWNEKRFNNVLSLQKEDKHKARLSDVIIYTDRNKRNTYNSINNVLNLCNYLKKRPVNEVLKKFL